MKIKFLLLLPVFFVSLLSYSQSKIKEIEDLMINNKIEEANRLIDKALYEDNNNSRLWFYKGIIVQNSIGITTPPEQKKAKLDSAYYYFTKASDYDEKNILSDILSENLLSVAQQYAYTGMEMFNTKKYNEALNTFELSMKIYNKPNVLEFDSMLLYNAAVSAEMAKKYDKAIFYYSKITENNPKDWNSIVALANAYKSQGKPDEYYKIISKANIDNPNSPLFYKELIGYYLENQKEDSALIFLNKVLLIDKMNDNLYYLKASILQEKGEIDKAKIEYNKCIEINNNNIDASFNLATIEYNEALDLLNKKKLKKSEKETLKEHLEKTLKYLEVVKKYEPENKYLPTMLMTCYEELSMKKEKKALQNTIEKSKKQ